MELQEELRGYVVTEDIQSLAQHLKNEDVLATQLNHKYKNDQTLLQWAVKNNRIESTKYLLTLGADRTLLDKYGLTPRELALNLGHRACATLLQLPPPPILDLRIINASSTSISLEWSDPTLPSTHYASILNYHIECYALQLNHKQIRSTTHTTYEFNQLLPAGEYLFRIWCESIAGWSPVSPSVCFFTSPAVPSAPPPIELHKVTTNGIYITWHASLYTYGSAIDDYELELMQTGAATQVWIRHFKQKGIKRDRFHTLLSLFILLY